MAKQVLLHFTLNLVTEVAILYSLDDFDPVRLIVTRVASKAGVFKSIIKLPSKWPHGNKFALRSR